MERETVMTKEVEKVIRKSNERDGGEGVR